MKKKTALITGATSGIGYEFAKIFAEKGYNLLLASRNKKKIDEIQSSFETEYGISVIKFPVDLSIPGSAKKIYEETRKKNIEINVLINNAGFGIQGEHVDSDIDKMAEMIQLNIIALTELCLLFGKKMKEKRRGHILNVASTAAYQPTPYVAAYASTKSYVLNFSEALAKEMEDYQVVVTCLSPGPTDTHFFDHAKLGDKKKGLFSNKTRMQSGKVAAIGVDALFAEKLSIISGLKNLFLAFINRFASRKITAIVSKKIMKDAIKG